MRKRTRHPNKHIEEAIVYAEEKGWKFKEPGRAAHAWGRLPCPLHSKEGHQMSIWSTPRNAYNHAQQICRLVNRCEHSKELDK